MKLSGSDDRQKGERPDGSLHGSHREVISHLTNAAAEVYDMAPLHIYNNSQ